MPSTNVNVITAMAILSHLKQLEGTETSANESLYIARGNGFSSVAFFGAVSRAAPLRPCKHCSSCSFFDFFIIAQECKDAAACSMHLMIAAVSHL